MIRLFNDSNPRARVEVGKLSGGSLEYHVIVGVCHLPRESMTSPVESKSVDDEARVEGNQTKRNTGKPEQKSTNTDNAEIEKFSHVFVFSTIIPN